MPNPTPKPFDRVFLDFEDDIGAPTRQVFRDPTEVVVAKYVDEVIPALDRVATHTKAGRFAVGFVAYEAAPAFEPAFAVRPGYAGPLVWFGIFNSVCHPERSEGVTDGLPPSLRSGRPEQALSLRPERRAAWQASISSDAYSSAVSEIVEGIHRGDYYQVNFTTRLRGPKVDDPLALYERLRLAQRGRYSAFIQTENESIISVSPELFFRRDGDRLETRPMKGTAARGRWSADDDAAAERLQMSEKERAENVMIVDLLRNDVGRISVPGSVEVTALFDIERYPTVLQMTSTVKSQVVSSTSLTDVFRALFPCGSVTGAPKIAAAGAIAELESEPRGAYCGAIGIVKPGGDCVFNVGIRTLVVQADGSATYGAGGGITADSNPEDEFAELEAKSVVLEVRPDDFDLFETMRLSRGVIARLERHLKRMSDSARYFGFASVDRSIPRLRDRLVGEATSHPTGTFRVRATLTRSGEHLVEVRPFVDSDEPRRMVIAAEPVSSTDCLLYHKTTRRETYTSRLPGRDAADDVILFNEGGEITECTIGNLVVELDGRLVTPPLECGLLPGVLRAELLEANQIAERIVTVEELGQSTRVWMINSLRGWIAVTGVGSGLRVCV